MRCSMSSPIPAPKLRGVYCAADVSNKPGDIPDTQDWPFRVVLVGNMTSSKGQEDAIRAVGLLPDTARGRTCSACASWRYASARIT